VSNIRLARSTRFIGLSLETLMATGGS